ncbi:hypothetical protein ACC725_38330, partial [Rhizobium ruizarguesonis]
WEIAYHWAGILHPTADGNKIEILFSVFRSFGLCQNKCLLHTEIAFSARRGAGYTFLSRWAASSSKGSGGAEICAWRAHLMQKYATFSE